MVSSQPNFFTVSSVALKAGSKVHAEQMEEAFYSLTTLTEDVQIVTGDGGSIGVSRALLSIFSPSLRKMFSDIPICVSPTVFLPDISTTTIRHLLSLLSTGVTTKDKIISKDVMSAAHLLRIQLQNIVSIPEKASPSENGVKRKQSQMGANETGKKLCFKFTFPNRSEQAQENEPNPISPQLQPVSPQGTVVSQLQSIFPQLQPSSATQLNSTTLKLEPTSSQTQPISSEATTPQLETKSTPSRLQTNNLQSINSELEPAASQLQSTSPQLHLISSLLQSSAPKFQSTSASPSSQSISLPLQSISPPLQSISPPLQSISPPLQSISPPLQSISPPLQSISLPLQSISLPLQSISLPLQSISPPLHSTYPPLQSTSPPLHSMSPLLHSASPPLQSTSPPLHSMSPLLHSTSSPLQSTSPPLQSTSSPLQSISPLLHSTSTLQPNSLLSLQSNTFLLEPKSVPMQSTSPLLLSTPPPMQSNFHQMQPTPPQFHPTAPLVHPAFPQLQASETLLQETTPKFQPNFQPSPGPPSLVSDVEPNSAMPELSSVTIKKEVLSSPSCNPQEYQVTKIAGSLSSATDIVQSLGVAESSGQTPSSEPNDTVTLEIDKECQICHETEAKLSSLWRHYYVKHFYKDLKMKFENKIINNSCPSCDAKFPAIQAVLLHLGRAHSEINQILTEKGLKTISNDYSKEKKKYSDAKETNAIISKTNAKEMVVKSEPIGCQLCDLNYFLNINEVWDHYCSVHFYEELKAEFGSFIKGRTCMPCKEKLASKKDAAKHIGTKHQKVNSILKSRNLEELSLPLATTKNLQSTETNYYLVDIEKNNVSLESKPFKQKSVIDLEANAIISGSTEAHEHNEDVEKDLELSRNNIDCANERVPISDEQQNILREEFSEDQSLSTDRRKTLAVCLGLTEEQIQNWFEKERSERHIEYEEPVPAAKEEFLKFEFESDPELSDSRKSGLAIALGLTPIQVSEYFKLKKSEAMKTHIKENEAKQLILNNISQSSLQSETSEHNYEDNSDFKTASTKFDSLNFIKISKSVESNKDNNTCRWKFENEQICGKVFTKTYNFTVHMRTHQDIRPFPCSFCEQTFRRSTHLQKHESRAHAKGLETLAKIASYENNKTYNEALENEATVNSITDQDLNVEDYVNVDYLNNFLQQKVESISKEFPTNKSEKQQSKIEHLNQDFSMQRSKRKYQKKGKLSEEHVMLLKKQYQEDKGVLFPVKIKALALMLGLKTSQINQYYKEEAHRMTNKKSLILSQIQKELEK